MREIYKDFPVYAEELRGAPMSLPQVWYKNPSDGTMLRSGRHCSYDPIDGTFAFDDDKAIRKLYHEKPGVTPTPEMRITITEAQVLAVNWEGRTQWNFTDAPCRCDGFGADVKAYSLVQSLRNEIAYGDPKPQHYVEWRAQYIKDFEKLGLKLEELKAAYPNIKDW